MDPAVPVEDSPAGSLVDRLIALTTIGVAGYVVIVLRMITPDGRGFGTHEQLGMEPCAWPGQYGIPCPTCGATTAATYVVHLSPWDAVVTHPFGAAFAVAGLWLACLAAVTLARRQSFVARLAMLPYGTAFGVGVVLLLASWGWRAWTWDA